jgi:ABC-2 type transport system permease protein
MSALIVAIYPSIADSLATIAANYPPALKEAFGFAEFDTVEAYLSAEMFSLVIPLALGYFMVRCIVHALPAAEERGELDIVLAAPVTRRELVAGSFAAAMLSAAGVLVVVLALTLLASVAVGAGLGVGHAVAGVAEVWPLAVFFAGVAVLATGCMSRASSVTALAAGGLVAMYVLDLAGRLADEVSGLRYVSAFKYYGSALTEGIAPLAFVGLALAGCVLAALGATAFERRDVRA